MAEAAKSLVNWRSSLRRTYSAGCSPITASTHSTLARICLTRRKPGNWRSGQRPPVAGGAVAVEKFQRVGVNKAAVVENMVQLVQQHLIGHKRHQTPFLPHPAILASAGALCVKNRSQWSTPLQACSSHRRLGSSTWKGRSLTFGARSFLSLAVCLTRTIGAAFLKVLAELFFFVHGHVLLFLRRAHAYIGRPGVFRQRFPLTGWGRIKSLDNEPLAIARNTRLT